MTGRIALKIKQLQPNVSNRQIAKALGVNRSTEDRDTGANAPSADKKPSTINAGETSAGANAPPVIAGAAAAKQRRYRMRLKQHQIAVVVPVSEAVINLVIRTGWLAERDAHRRELVANAIARMLADAAQHMP
ncbi:hypothetical protein [Bradyrhizobium sp. S3.2.12]|uniref:hypothetical protein n=1 Tax=Bradyrhizobium sp. S3.2.12 TaxID=3156387 RepID=UPI003396B790